MGDVIRAMDYLYDLPSPEQPAVAKEIMDNMRESPNGFMSLGYLIGYYEPEKRKALYKILGIDNPMTGKFGGEK